MRFQRGPRQTTFLRDNRTDRQKALLSQSVRIAFGLSAREGFRERRLETLRRMAGTRHVERFFLREKPAGFIWKTVWETVRSSMMRRKPFPILSVSGPGRVIREARRPGPARSNRRL